MAKGRRNNSTDTKNLSDLSKMADTDKVTVVSEKRAGKTIIGLGNSPVVFDADGKAEVTVVEAKYFLTIPGFKLDEAAEANADAGDGDGNKEVSDETSETTNEETTEKSESGDNAEAAEANADAEKAKKTVKR